MAHRKSFPIPIDWANALNLVDVVFADHPKVLASWRSLYDYVHVKPMDLQQYEHRKLELLSEMAVALGYKSLRQIDIDRFYMPQSIGDQAVMNNALQIELLNFLRKLQNLAAMPQAAAEPPPKVEEKKK